MRAEQARHGDSRQRDIREVGINHHDAPTSSSPSVALLLQDFTFEGKRWWTHIEFLAGDALEGRNVGTPGFEKAVAYVESQFQDIGLKPGGASGYRQPVELESRELVPAQTKLALVRNGVEEPLTLREDATLNARGALNGTIDAPMVFVGYGLSIPEAGGTTLRDSICAGKWPCS